MTPLIDENEYNNITGAWDYGLLPDNVRVGKDCFLARRDSFKLFRSTRNPGLVLGDGVKVFTWTEFNIEPMGAVVVGDKTLLVGAIFMCAESVRIGSRAIISYNVTIADSDFHPRDPELRKRDAIANAPEGDRTKRPPILSQPVVIEDDVWIGIGAIILKGVRIGRGAQVAAGAVVTSDIPQGAKAAGNPATVVRDGG